MRKEKGRCGWGKTVGKTKEDWNFFLDPKSARPIFGKFPETAIMDGIKLGNFNLLWSVIIAVVLVALIYVYLKYTKHGYEIAVVGDSAATAKYAGMKVGRIIMRTMFISSALIGLAAGLTASASGTISFIVRTGAQTWVIAFGEYKGNRVGLSHRGAAAMAKRIDRKKIL